jgi:ABC-2 type transport system permease protein
VRLFGVEISRLRSRRIFKILAVVAFLGIAGAVALIARDALPPSAADRAGAERAAQQEMESCRNKEAKAQDEDPGADFGCDQMTPDMYLGYTEFSFRERAPSVLGGAAIALGLAAFLIGASYLGADISSRTLNTQLLFEPRRTRMFVTKVSGLSAGMAVFGIVGIGLVAAGLYGIAWRWGTLEKLTSGFWQSLGLAGLRGLAVVVGAAIGGMALAGLLRHTAAAIGVLAAYAVIGEFAVRSVFERSERWLFTSNLIAWVNDGFQTSIFHCPRFGGECVEQKIQLSVTQGGLYVGGILLGAALLAWLAFRRRDVT